MSSNTLYDALENTLLETTFSVLDELQGSYDVVIQFHSAEVINTYYFLQYTFII